MSKCSNGSKVLYTVGAKNPHDVSPSLTVHVLTVVVVYGHALARG
jgi:hypothetical protein